MSDLERQVSVLLAERVDAAVGPRRPPPAFDPRHQTVYPIAVDRPAAARAVVIALVAAACVVAVLLGTVGLSRLSSNRTPTPPSRTTPAPSPAVTTPAPSASHPSATATSTPSGVPPGAGRTVTMAGARLTLPAGWVVGPTPPNMILSPLLCLTLPRDATVDRPSTPRCLVTFGTMARSPVPGQLMDSDTQGGLESDPHPCGMDPETDTVTAENRLFGNQAADFRAWRIVCHPDGRVVRIAQYVVPFSPGFVLYSDSADGDVVRAMEFMAASAHLPAPSASAPVRMYDVGYIRSVSHLSGGGVRIVIDRVVPDGLHWANNSHRTYSYDVPDNGRIRLSILKVGALVKIHGDGRTVVDAYRISP